MPNNTMIKSNGEIMTEHFHMYQGYNHYICYFEILMPNGKYILWEFLDHKLYNKDTWKLLK